MAKSHPTSILITGASSGIGAALAQAYARPGVYLFLNGRDMTRLDAVTERCQALGATVDARIIDATDAQAMALWIEACDAVRPLDMVIANAGVSGGMQRQDGDTVNEEALYREIHAVNVDGVKNTVEPAIAVMRARQRGQVAIMSSLAGLRSMPSAPAYSASKVAVRKYGERLHRDLQPSGIGVSVIMPGFVKSRITDQNSFRMPMLMEAPRAAEIIREGLSQNRARIAFPFPMYAVMWIIAALPTWLGDILLSGLPKKG